MPNWPNSNFKKAGIVFTSKVVMTEEDYVHEIQEFSPDLILSDYDLPRYNGALALTEARRRCPDTPFILVTGAVTEDRAIDILTQGAKDYVLKNRLQQRLVPAIRRALAEVEEHRARKKAEEDLRKAHRNLESLVEQRTTELQTVLDTAPIAIWIAHDPECKVITGNAYADEMIMQTTRSSNISRSATSGEAAVSYKVFHDGVELKPEEMPAQVAAATGKPVTDMEVELVFSDGRHVHMIESAMPLLDSNGRVRGAVITGSDISKHKQSENNLRRSEERHRLVLKASSLGTFELDLLTGESIWNEAEFELFGLTPGSPQTGPDTFFRFVHPGDLQMMQDRWEEAKRTGKLDAEFRILRADGQERWLAGKGRFFSDGKPEGNDPGARGKALRFMGVNFDITERKRAVEQLRESESILRAFFDSPGMMRGIIEVADGNIQFVSVNKAVADAYGLEPEEVIGRPISELGVPPDEVKLYLDSCEEARRSGQEVSGEIFRHLAYGDRWLLSNGSYIGIGSAGLPRFAFVMLDITARKAAEAKLRESERLYRAIGESIDYGIWVCDPGGRNIYASKSFLNLVGMTQEQCSDFGWGDVLHPDDAERTIAAWKECVRTGGIWDIVHRFKGVDGQWHPILARGVPVRNEQGEVICWAGINLDISLLKKARKSLK